MPIPNPWHRSPNIWTGLNDSLSIRTARFSTQPRVGALAAKASVGPIAGRIYVMLCKPDVEGAYLVLWSTVGCLI